MNVLSPAEFEDMVGQPGAGFVSVMEGKSKGTIAKCTVADGAGVTEPCREYRRRRSARIRRKAAEVITRGIGRGTCRSGWSKMHEVFSEVGQAISSAVASGGSSSSWDFRSFQGSFVVSDEDDKYYYAVVTTKLNRLRLVRCSDSGAKACVEYDIAPRSFHRLKHGDVVSGRSARDEFFVLRSLDPWDSYANCKQRTKSGGGSGGPSARMNSGPQVASLMWLTHLPRLWKAVRVLLVSPLARGMNMAVNHRKFR